MQIWMSYSNSACRITSIYWISVWYIISLLNYSEMCVFIVCKLITSPDLVYDDILCKFECHVRIRHVELPLFTEFQVDISILFWIIAKFVFSLSLNWLRHQIWSIMTFYANLNVIFGFSMSNYLYIPNVSFIYHFPFEL